MYIDRVNAMIGFLERIREQMRLDKKNKKNFVVGFDLETWADTPKDDNDNYCGTTCCAIGHATLDPYFRKNGLRMVFEYKNNYREEWKSRPVHNVNDLKSADNIIRKDVVYHFSIRYTDPVTKIMYTEFAGVDRFFGFKGESTSYILFAPDSYKPNNKSIRNVISRLKYLASKGEDAFESKYS